MRIGGPVQKRVARAAVGRAQVCTHLGRRFGCLRLVLVDVLGAGDIALKCAAERV